MSNDLGSWSLATPGTVEVAVSSEALHVACRREGFRDASVELRCIRPSDRSTMHGAMTGLQLVSSVGQAAILLPSPGALVGVLAGAVIVGAMAGHASAGPDADVCMYGALRELRLSVYLDPVS